MTQNISTSSTLPSGSVVWAYLRSSAAGDQGNSIEQQRAAIQTFCQQHGLSLERVFADEEAPAGPFQIAQQLKELLDLATSTDDRPKGGVVWNLSRLSRNVDIVNLCQHTLKKSGVVIQAVTDCIEAQTI